MEPEPEGEAQPYAMNTSMPEPEPEPTMYRGGGPYFLFPPPVLHGHFYDIQAATLGSLFALELAIALLATAALFRHISRDARLVLLSVVAVTGLRAAFFVVDPWHVPERLPALAVALIFGAPFPLRNLMTVLLFFTLRRLVLRVESGRSHRALTKSGSAPTESSVATRIRTAALLTCAIEMGVQIASDTMRALGYSFPILRACKAFFVAWGLATALGFSLWTVRLRRLSRSALRGIAASAPTVHATTRQGQLRRLFGCFWACAVVGLVTACSSIAYLAMPAIHSDGDVLGVLYTLDHTAELLQCAAALALVTPKAAARRRSTLVRAATINQSQAKAALSCTADGPVAQLSSPMESSIRRSDSIGDASPGPDERWHARLQRSCANVDVDERGVPAFAVVASAEQRPGPIQRAESGIVPIAAIVIEDHDQSLADFSLADDTSPSARVTAAHVCSRV